MSTLRLIEAGDLPQIAEIHKRQIESLTQRFWSKVPEDKRPKIELPDASAPHIFQVAVGERDGAIFGAAYFEAEVEVQVIADNPEFLELIREKQPNLENSLRIRNYKTLRAFIPRGLCQIGAMRRKGFTHMNPKWDCFMKSL